jgi:hypothetical protein
MASLMVKMVTSWPARGRAGRRSGGGVDDTGRPGGRDLDDGLGGRGVVPRPGRGPAGGRAHHRAHPGPGGGHADRGSVSPAADSGAINSGNAPEPTSTCLTIRRDALMRWVVKVSSW